MVVFTIKLIYVCLCACVCSFNVTRFSLATASGSISQPSAYMHVALPASAATVNMSVTVPGFQRTWGASNNALLNNVTVASGSSFVRIGPPQCHVGKARLFSHPPNVLHDSSLIVQVFCHVPCASAILFCDSRLIAPVYSNCDRRPCLTAKACFVHVSHSGCGRVHFRLVYRYPLQWAWHMWIER